MSECNRCHVAKSRRGVYFLQHEICYTTLELQENESRDWLHKWTRWGCPLSVHSAKTLVHEQCLLFLLLTLSCFALTVFKPSISKPSIVCAVQKKVFLKVTEGADIFNRPSYSCVLSDLVLDWKRGWG